MKKIFILFLIFLFSVPVRAEDITINMNYPQDENIDKQMAPVYPLLIEAQKENNIDKYYKVSVKGYKIKKTGNHINIKNYNDILSASAIQFALQRYELTKDKKYLKRAYKWSKISVKDKTKQIYAIRADIFLAGLFLNIKEMQRAYDLYRTVDIKSANDFLTEYKENLDIVKKQIELKNLYRQQKMAYMGLALCGGLQAYGQSAQKTYNSNSRTHCYTIGNDLYCNSY